MGTAPDEREQELNLTRLDPALNNVEAIAMLERDALLDRSLGERVADTITRGIGTTACVVLHLAWFATWVTINLGMVPALRPFDPFPFGILTLIVSGEGVILAILILVSQNRMQRQADRRSHLDLQVSMLAEQELTLVLKLQQRMCEHFGIDAREQKEEVVRLTRRTDVQELVQTLGAKLPDE